MTDYNDGFKGCGPCQMERQAIGKQGMIKLWETDIYVDCYYDDADTTANIMIGNSGSGMFFFREGMPELTGVITVQFSSEQKNRLNDFLRGTEISDLTK